MDAPAPERRSRFATFNEFVDRGQAHLRSLKCGAAAALWFTLWRFESADTGTVRVGVDTLAECYGSDRRNVQKMISQLEEHGYLAVVEPGARGRGSCAVYRLQVPVINASPVRVSVPDKGVPETRFETNGKRVLETPIPAENAYWRSEKRVLETHVQKVQKKKPIAADAAAKGAGVETKARARRPLFDAIAEVTGSAPKASGAHIAKVEKALSAEDPPFTPDEVHEFTRRFWELCPWAARDRRERPELNELQKYIGKVRAAKKPTAPRFNALVDFDSQPPVVPPAPPPRKEAA